jgi:hypothetical protein
MSIKIINTEKTELYGKYNGQSETWPCYIYLDCQENVLYAKAVPEKGWDGDLEINGHIQKFSIPPLIGSAADSLMKEILPFAKKVVLGYSVDWNEKKAVFTKKAQEALDAIEGIAGSVKQSMDDIICSWDAEEWLFDSIQYLDSDGDPCSSDDDFTIVDINGIGTISAETSNEQLSEFAENIEVDAQGQDVDVLDGLLDLLKKLRDGCTNKEIKIEPTVAQAGK